MINTNNFFKRLGELLREYYHDIKNTGTLSPEREHFINGYLTAARTLNAVYQKDLADYVERIHFEIFGMTIDQRQKSLPVQSNIAGDALEVPAFKRKGIRLKF
jgi:hypothetical protein